MSYRKKLSPWAIYRHLPNLQRLLIARYRRRNDAEAYLKTIQGILPQAQFEIVYDVSEEERDRTQQERAENNPSVNDAIPLSTRSEATIAGESSDRAYLS